MVLRFQITIDCADPTTLVRFWAVALGYLPKPPPDGFPTWNAWYSSVGVPDDELDLSGDGQDRLFDPDGVGAPIWFQVVPETKSLKNRIHLDLDVGYRDGERLSYAQRRPLVDAKAAELVRAGATELRRTDVEEHGFYYVVMADPEGNEFCLR